ncbi:hypothetical protein ZHAS_00017807 [Anopheles sinensis]|uniref:Uncharacterized protein n=1 Tax=Anopheles sinensis TaxID=74873 RepID=A0A084WHU6_ANOSI|nr:hypothetical protein ZHAS_00017807 [Anopheles sinensis]
MAFHHTFSGCPARAFDGWKSTAGTSAGGWAKQQGYFQIESMGNQHTRGTQDGEQQGMFGNRATPDSIGRNVRERRHLAEEETIRKSRRLRSAFTQRTANKRRTKVAKIDLRKIKKENRRDFRVIFILRPFDRSFCLSAGGLRRNDKDSENVRAA